MVKIDHEVTMSKIMAIAIPELNMEDWNFLQNYRQQYDPRGYAFIDPHFTLFSTTTRIDKNLLSQQVKAQLTTIKRIKFNIKKSILMPPSNDHKSWYAYLIPKNGSDCIIKIHQLIKQKMICDETLSFIPHIAIGSFQDQAECKQLITHLNMKKINIHGELKTIKLVEIVNNQLSMFDEINLE
jgi:2'-5' RNA ligase